MIKPFSSVLHVNLAAIAENWQLLASKLKSPASCGAVVKANAYGTGVIPVSTALAKAGCTHFFVATLEEGIELRAALKEKIYVFNGVAAGEEAEFLHHNLIPMLNTPEQVERWEKVNKPSALHLDTGMCRLGLTLTDVKNLTHPPSSSLIISHLACADEPQHPENQEQLQRFEEMAALLPATPKSLCNSSGIFLGGNYHFDLVRPGCALYGINPTPDAPNPMQAVATLTAPVLQIRHLDRDESVGYDATYRAKKGTRIATIGLGYADGLFRSLSNHMNLFIEGHKCPLVGRISMDMVMIDISSLPESLLKEGLRAELLGPHQPVDVLAEQAGTIGYEVFTRLGRRIVRVHNGGQQA